MRYQELLEGLGRQLETELKPDDAGMVALAVDDMVITILGIEETGTLALRAVVGEPPPEEHLDALYRTLLEANYNFAGTSGATLSCNPEKGEISLCKLLFLEMLDDVKFVQEMENFVNVLETWRRLVSDFRAVVKEGGGDRGVEDVPNAGTDFMQV